jgi:S-DNA-T family DNA segregation ATPase FtsK/SpoIIIE
MAQSPRDINFIMIDPKRVELIDYKRIPHTILYASESQAMRDALQRAQALCDIRFQEMQRKRIKKYDGSAVYLIIDELADLMLTDKTTKPTLQRIAQIGRAAEVHIIAATQTPISKVLPTEIKCNFDSRIGLRTRSAQDSRNIIGIPGLEKLPAYGEGILMGPQAFTHYKFPMISDAERENLIKYWTKPKLFTLFSKSRK